tara:strand:+ start:28 stop:1275 length:1248 start_codon:yes stop_codon:yes gene_type:complete
MAIDFTGMFTGKRPDPSVVSNQPPSGLGPSAQVAMQVMQQGEQRARAGLGQLVGRDLRSPADQAREQMSQFDLKNVNTPEGLFQLASMQQQAGNMDAAATLASQARTLEATTELNKQQTQAKIKNREELAKLVSAKDPELGAAIRAEANTGSTEALKLGLKALTPSLSSENRAGRTFTMQDEDGNAYAMTNSFNNSSGQMEMVYAPIGNAPKYDGQKKLTPTGGKFAESAEDVADREAKAAQRKEEAKGYGANRVLAMDSLPTLNASRSEILKARDVLATISTGGPVNLVALGLDKYFGKTSKDKAWLEYTLGMNLAKSLKPLFGGLISDNESKRIEAISAGLYRGNEANAGIIDQLLKTLEDSILKAELYSDNEDMGDFAMALNGMFRKPTGPSTNTTAGTPADDIIDISALPL